MKTNRYSKATELSDTLVEVVMDKAEAKVGQVGRSAYTVGYLSSVLARVAAASPTALKELEQTLLAARG